MLGLADLQHRTPLHAWLVGGGYKRDLAQAALSVYTGPYAALCVLSESCDSDIMDSGAVLDIQDTAGDTPLHLSVRTKSVEVARLLLQKGANPNIRNRAVPAALFACGALADRLRTGCLAAAQCPGVGGCNVGSGHGAIGCAAGRARLRH
jgi:ankyrin repeat protein